MNCTDVENIIVDYIDGMLAADQKEHVDNHISECEKCLNEMKKTRALFNEMNEIDELQPDSSLRENFYSMLEDEKQQQNKKNKTLKHPAINQKITLRVVKYAASFIILISIGFLAGKNSAKDELTGHKLAQLEQQVNQLQNNITVTQLSKPSASERIQAVHVINKQEKPDTKMINALIHTLNNDDNINVRLAAANALTKYSGHEFVDNALINSLTRQEDPIMQITLINILVQLQDERAIQPLKQIAEKEDNPPIVKEQAKEGLKLFI